MLSILILLLAAPASAEMAYGNRVRRTGDTMTGSLMISGSSLTVDYGILAGSGTFTSSLTVTAGSLSITTSATAAAPMLFIDPVANDILLGTTTFITGQLNLSSAPTASVVLQMGKGPTGESYINNLSPSGVIRFMGGKANPQIILGSAQSTGSGFFDMSSGRTLFINGLSSATTEIGQTGLDIFASGSLTAPAGSTGTFVNLIGSGRIYPQITFVVSAAGGAGAVATATCGALSFALSGGCSCTGAVAVTGVVNMLAPTVSAGGAMPTGWQCQQTGGTGAVCTAYVMCSHLQL